MEKRSLGRSGIEGAPFALGTNVFGWTIKSLSLLTYLTNLHGQASI
jgi:aryl-alcohol dehydrogenase-like predicted oxidoreductase